MKFNLTIKCDDADAEELAAIAAKLSGKVPVKPVKEEPADEKPTKRPAKEEPSDEKPAKRAGKVDKVAEQREEIRDKLREFSEKTDRKTAVKLLNKFADSVDEVEESDLDDLLEAINEAIENA